MGTHISTVRSTTLDEWTPVQIKSIHSKGNGVVNAVYEANLGKTSKISTTSDDRSREDYIRNKYERKAFYGAPNDEMREFKKEVKSNTPTTPTTPSKPKKKVEKVEPQPTKISKIEEPSMIDFGSDSKSNNNSSLSQFVFDSNNDGFPEPDEFEKQAMRGSQITQPNLLNYTKNDTEKKSNIMALFDEAKLPAPMKPQIISQPVYQQQNKPMMNPYQQQNKPMMYQSKPMYGNQQPMMYQPQQQPMMYQQPINNLQKPMMYQQQQPMMMMNGNQKPMYGNQQPMMYQQHKPMMGQQQFYNGNNYQQTNNFKF